MTQHIKTSIEWNNIEPILLRQSSGLRHSKDIKRMISNIRTNVVGLSKEEVEMRRGRSNKVTMLLENINNDIEMIEEYILVAALIG